MSCVAGGFKCGGVKRNVRAGQRSTFQIPTTNKTTAQESSFSPYQAPAKAGNGVSGPFLYALNGV